MRIFYVTADGSRVGVLERALARDASAPHHVEVATTAEAVVGRAGALEPVVVLVDGELPHTSPESAVASLRAHLPRARILVISEEPSAEHAGRLLLAGADEAILHTQLSDLPARLARHGAGADDPRRIIRLGIVTDDGELADAAANAAGAAATRLSVGAGGALTAPEGNLVDAVQFDVLVFDERRPHPETASVLHASRERVPPPAVVVLARAEDGASWLRLGACEVVHEADAARLVGALARAQQWRRTHLEQAQLRGKEARLRGLVESIPEGVLLSAPDGAILALNVAGLKLVGARGPRDVVGKKVADLVGDADRGVVSELLEAVVKGESRTTTLAVRRLDGSTAAIDVKAVPFQREPGRPAAMLAILREASARTAQAEEEWQEIPLAYDPAIESKLDELTRTLEEARSEVLASRERVDQLRNAHESEQAVWQGRFDELTAARDALAASLQALEAQQRDEAQRLASRLEAVRDEERQQAEARLAALRAEFDEAQRAWSARLEALDAERAAALAGLSDLRAAHEAEVAALARRLAEERREAEEALRAEIDAARADLTRRDEEWQARFDETTRAHAALDHELSGAREALTAERGALAVRIEELEAAVRQAAEREAQVAIETGVRSLRVRELEQQVEAADARVAALEGERGASQRNQASVLEASARSLQEAQQAVAQAERRAAELQREVEALGRDREQAQAACAAAQALAEEAERQVEAMRAESAGHESRLRTLAGDLESRESLANDLEERVRASQQALDEANAERQRLEGALAEAGRRLVEALEAAERQQALAESRQSEMAETAAGLSAAEREREAARAEIEALTARLAAAETARQQSGRYDERYGWLFDFDEIGRMVVARDGTVISSNDAAASMCGARTTSEFVGVRTPATDLFTSALAASESRNGRQEFPRRFEICLQHGDGLLHWILGVAQPQAGPGDAMDWMLLDVSDRHLVARRSRYLRRVDALTHVLASATTECAGLMREVGDTLRAAGDRGPGAADAEQWQHAKKAVARTRSVLQQLSGFAQKRSRRPQVLELNEVLDKASVLLSRLAGEETPCETRIAAEPILVSIDPGEFEQLLTNAVIAARDSLPAGGHVVVTAGKKDADTELGGMPLTRREAVVSIEAEGFGAAEGVVSPKLMDLVTRVGGELDLDHEPEVRTTFHIAMPLVHRIERADQSQDQAFPAKQPQGT